MAEQKHTPENLSNQKYEDSTYGAKEEYGASRFRKILMWLGLPSVLVGLFMIVYLWFFPDFTPEYVHQFFDVVEELQESEQEKKKKEETVQINDFLPTSTTGEIIRHRNFTLSYSEKHEQAEWVTYTLTVEELNNYAPNRTNDFRADPSVRNGSATLKDYRGSGYDRGHLCPAADKSHSVEAVSETFLMSNMSPQEPGFNRGIWRELEAQVRDWSRVCKKMIIVTGPVLTKRAKKRIGEKKRLAVPRAFYKVLLDYEEPEKKAVGFIVPNEKSDKPISEYMVSVDDVEELTGLDFFPNLPEEEEKFLEHKYNPFRWIYDEERFQKRVQQWNAQAPDL